MISESNPSPRSLRRFVANMDGIDAKVAARKMVRALVFEERAQAEAALDAAFNTLDERLTAEEMDRIRAKYESDEG